MGEFPFEWQLNDHNAYHQQRKCHTSNFKINTEWSLNCFWKTDDSRPEFLEIRRNSNDRDILVSGTFEVLRGKTCCSKRKFTQLIEDGLFTTLVELDPQGLKGAYTRDHLLNESAFQGFHGRNVFTNDYGYNSTSYSITGTLNIPAFVAIKKKAKGVNFDSLLEMSSDFKRLLDPKATYFSDVNLKCGTVSFPAHKNILSVRSPVFAAMFTTEMKENLENKVNISDIGPNVLQTMLIYIYTGKTGALSVQSAGELLFAGDKYQLQDLKKVCSDYLKSCVSVENVLKTLVLGYLHDEELKAFATDFICGSCVEFEVIEKTPEWKNLLEKIPSLAMYVLTRLVKSKDEKLKRKK